MYACMVYMYVYGQSEYDDIVECMYVCMYVYGQSECDCIGNSAVLMCMYVCVYVCM